MSKYKINLTKSSKKGRVKPDFVLLPQQRRAPIIKSQPIRNFIQYSHLDDRGNPLAIQPTDNIITVLKGTTISFGAIVEDPSNNLDPFSDINLKFVWKQNGAELYSVSLLNDGKGSSAIYLDGTLTTPEINGVYTLEITNDYGTTISEAFTLEVIDTLEHPLLYRNLIQNDNGSRGLETWNTAGGVVVKQMAKSLIETQNFGSIWNGAAQTRTNGTDLDDYQNEIPFVFGNSSNWVNFDILYQNIQKGNSSFMKEREFWYTRVTPNLINNERPGQDYGSFFPSPTHVDAANANQNKPGNLVSSLGLTDTYFTRDKILFSKNGGQRQASMNQTIDIANVASLVDGNVPGISKIISQFFAYVGIGISKYEYKITYQDNSTTTVPTTYLLDSLQLDEVLNEGGDPTKALRRDLQEVATGNSLRTLRLTTKQIKSVDIIPISQDKVTINIDCLDAGGSVIDTVIINGPDETDIFAVKEKFYISEMFSTLFSISLDLKKQETDIPFFIFGKQYFQLPGLGAIRKREEQLRGDISRIEQLLKDVSDQIKEIESIRATPLNPLVSARDLAAKAAELAKLPGLKSQQKVFQNQLTKLRTDLQSTSTSIKAITDQNRLWLSQNHSKSGNAISLRNTVFKDQNVFLVDRFDKGAAAMFGIDKTIIIPSKTRTLSVSILYDHTSKAFYDQNPNYPSSTNLIWDKDEIYGEHAADLRRYSYNDPKVAITQIKLQLFPNRVQVHPTYPTYIMPRTQVLPAAKADLFKDIHNSTQKLVYKTYRPSLATPLTGSALDQIRNTPIQAIVNIGNDTNLSAKDIATIGIL